MPSGLREWHVRRPMVCVCLGKESRFRVLGGQTCRRRWVLWGSWKGSAGARAKAEGRSVPDDV